LDDTIFNAGEERKSIPGADDSRKQVQHGRGQAMTFRKMVAIGIGCAALAACGGGEQNTAADTNLTGDMNMGTTDMNLGDLNMTTDLNATDVNGTLDSSADANSTDPGLANLSSTNAL
jgi:hypothetical protein